MVVKYVFLIVITVVTVAALGAETTDLYPPYWKPYCDVKNDNVSINITCRVKKGDPIRIKLKDLNEYSRNTSKDVLYSVELNCSPGGEISMSLPMKVWRLYDLKVYGCIIYDYIDDWNDHSLAEIDDSVVYIEMADCITKNNLKALFENMENFKNTSNEWMCGSDTTLKKHISRNITISLDIPPEMIPALPDMIPSNSTVPSDVPGPLTWQNSLEIIDKNYNPNCQFDQLEVLEETYIQAIYKKSTKVIFLSVVTYPNLRVYNFSRNGYLELPTEWNEYSYKFPKLEYIDYSYNLFSELKNLGFNGQISDKDTIIDVSYNNITKLTTQTIRDWADLTNVLINIRGNPLNCNCLQKDFIFAVQKDDFFKENLQKYKYIQDMTCDTPKSAKDIKLKDLTEVDMGCEIPPRDLTIYLIVLGVVAVVLLTMIVLMFYFRKEIKIYLYIRFGIIFPWDTDDKTENKKFDAFISYSSMDSDWIFDYLVKELETPSDSQIPLSLCIHGRDFIGGISILQNIIDSIENSRHTIVVLSRHFMKSVWAMAEFKEAYEESITKKRRHLIMIKYEDIPEAEMDTTLKRCLRTFTYLDVKDKMFIDRLRFAIAIKSRPAPELKREESNSSSTDPIFVQV